MSLVADPVARARAAKTKTQAARLHVDLEAELALNENLPPGWEAKAEEALRILEQKHTQEELRDPDVAGGPQGTGYAPKLSRGAKRGEAGPQPPKPAQKDPSAPSGPGRSSEPRARGGGGSRAGSRAAGRRATRPRSLLTGRTGRAAEQTGIPSAGRSAGRFALEVLGLMIGLSILYLLLRDAQSSRSGGAIASLSNGIAGLTERIVQPIDPLAPAGWRDVDRSAKPAKQPAGAGATAGAQLGSNVVPLEPRRLMPTARENLDDVADRIRDLTAP